MNEPAMDGSANRGRFRLHAGAGAAPFLLVLAFLSTTGTLYPDQPPAGTVGALLLEGARMSIVRSPRYDGSWVRLEYPGGDPGWDVGVCSDVVIRAFRHAGLDLQRLVHEDILAAPDAYGIRRPDPSIDHRRVSNLAVFFSRHARRLPPDRDWRAGDIVVWSLSGSGWPNHIGIVTNETGRSGDPLVIHHFPRTARFSGRPEASDCLHAWRIVHHFRWTEEPSGPHSPI